MSVPLSSSDLDQTGRHPNIRGLGRLLDHSRTRAIFLQSLVAGILSYELLVSNETVFGHRVSLMVAAGLILVCCGIMMLPRNLLENTWFPGALISINTLFVTGTIYLSGTASSELYLTYFLLLLIAVVGPVAQATARSFDGDLRRVWRVGLRTYDAVGRARGGASLGHSRVADHVGLLWIDA